MSSSLRSRGDVVCSGALAQDTPGIEQLSNAARILRVVGGVRADRPSITILAVLLLLAHEYLRRELGTLGRAR